MDGSVADHSDSDSGESWTLLEHSPSYAEEAPELPDNLTSHESGTPEVNADKDEDTDGISIISDSEPESSSPCEINVEKYLESHAKEQDSPHYISVTPLPNSIEQHESIRNEDDFLSDTNGKNKTYVHRRNKRLSTVLNIIMLGSVITAAGVAIGHMWGAKNDCSMHTTPSVNKILSNLYKLQEENAYLRSKLKELTLVSNIQLQRQTATDKITQKPHRCRKVYEVSLNNKATDRVTKCVDNNNVENILEGHFIQQEYEKEFLSDIDKLKNVYCLNKSWLDEEVTKRMKYDVQYMKQNKGKLQGSQLNTVQEEQNESKQAHSKMQNKIHSPPTKTKPLETEDSQFVQVSNTGYNKDLNEISIEKKITYADSLKTEQPESQDKKKQISENNKVHIKDFKGRNNNKNTKDGFDALQISLSEFKLVKDDRYIGAKNKHERKKYDRQKLHKKQKRKNKYEQWEMKGGYMKDYDDISMTSLQNNNEHATKTSDSNIAQDYEANIIINQLPEIEKFPVLEGNEHKAQRDKYFRSDKVKENNKNKVVDWHEKRAALRTEARKKLEQEMFGENTPNNARWYFRRMQKREQCRAKGDNSTNKKFLKRLKNYKVKH